MNKPNDNPKTPRRLRPFVARVYRNGTIIFGLSSLIVAGFVVFLAFSTTTIAVQLTPRSIAETTSVTIRPNAAATDELLPGTIGTATVEETVNLNVPTAGQVVDDFARGTVTFVNATASTQPLAATTRLRASSNGLIYRTTKRVDVTPGSQITAEVVADEAGTKGNIGPDRFEIVALWPGLKDKIYATSGQAMTGGTRSDARISAGLISQAEDQLKEKVVAAAKSNAPSSPADETAVGKPFIVEQSTRRDAEPGEQKSELTVKGSAKVAFIFVQTEPLEQLTTKILNNALRPGEELVSSSPTLTWNILEANATDSSARVELHIQQDVRLKSNAEQLAPAKFTKKTKKEILSQLLGTPGVSRADLQLSPFWATRTSSSPSQIKVVVTTAQ
ncbi:MAG: hypothetical protein HY420_01810 [Candidatus Kerfeldbacteria bacterium]|nr:hypothetical protein [Candidatus Kerfeldbacteria bacterium]